MVEILQSDAPVENPEVLRVRKRGIDLADYRSKRADSHRRSGGYRNASLADVGRLLKGNWYLFDEDVGAVTVAYLRIREDISEVVPILNRVKIGLTSRSDGTPVLNRVVGYLERNPIRNRDFCTMTSLAKDDPEAHAAILHYAQLAKPYYAEVRPELYAKHMAMAADVLDEYRIEDSPFTSGNLNRDNVIPYHFDAGNFREVWSLMLGWKKDVGPDADGNAGELVLPEYDLALGIEDNTLTAFDGQVSLHGVTPFRKLSRDAYRYTLVAYSKVGMWQCLNLDEEIARAKKVTTEKARRRYENKPDLRYGMKADQGKGGPA